MECYIFTDDQQECDCDIVIALQLFGMIWTSLDETNFNKDKKADILRESKPDNIEGVDILWWHVKWERSVDLAGRYAVHTGYREETVSTIY